MTVSNSQKAILQAYAKSFVVTAAAHAPEASFEDIARAAVEAAREAYTQRNNAEADAARAKEVNLGTAKVQPVNQQNADPFPTFGAMVGEVPGKVSAAEAFEGKGAAPAAAKTADTKTPGADASKTTGGTSMKASDAETAKNAGAHQKASPEVESDQRAQADKWRSEHPHVKKA